MDGACNTAKVDEPRGEPINTSSNINRRPAHIGRDSHYASAPNSLSESLGAPFAGACAQEREVPAHEILMNRVSELFHTAENLEHRAREMRREAAELEVLAGALPTAPAPGVRNAIRRLLASSRY